MFGHFDETQRGKTKSHHLTTENIKLRMTQAAAFTYMMQSQTPRMMRAVFGWSWPAGVLLRRRLQKRRWQLTSHWWWGLSERWLCDLGWRRMRRRPRDWRGTEQSSAKPGSKQTQLQAFAGNLMAVVNTSIYCNCSTWRRPLPRPAQAPNARKISRKWQEEETASFFSFDGNHDYSQISISPFFLTNCLVSFTQISTGEIVTENQYRKSELEEIGRGCLRLILLNIIDVSFGCVGLRNHHQRANYVTIKCWNLQEQTTQQ